MENKTVVQELVEYFEKDTTTMINFFVMFMSRRYDLLEKEKQQIENAVTYGNRQEFYDGTETLGQKYYQLTFKNK